MKKSVTMRAFKVYGAYNPKYFPLKFLQILFHNCAPYFNLWLSSEIVNALYEGRGRKEVYILVAVTLIGNLIIHSMGALLYRNTDIQLKLLENEEAAAFNRKVLSLDYNKLEDPKIRQHRRRIIENAWVNFYGVQQMRHRMEILMESLVNFAFGLMLFGEMLSAILRVGFQKTGVLLLAAMLVCIGLNVVWNFIYDRRLSLYRAKIGEEMLEENRLGNVANTSGLDSRVYRQQDLINKLDEKCNKKHLEVFTEAQRKGFLYSIPSEAVLLAMNLCAYLIVVFYCVQGAFPVGSVIKYVGYLGRFTGSIGNFFRLISGMKDNEPYLQTYLDFLDIKNDMYQGSLAVEKRSDKRYDIEFKNVSFRYPGAEEDALKEINLKLKVGERLAVVGVNGSGKTTFIKLLCRLYDPSQGEIFMNDFNIRKYDYRQYLDIFSVVFQDYALLAMSLGCNVAAAGSWDTKKAERILEEVGFGERYAQMEKKLDTPIYKNFDEDGVNVSGGEAQKIALARALYREAPFIILDEPTAALDPIAEAEIYSRFDRIVGDKTAIYISHRLSSCRFCDRIAVFDKGRIVQIGTHEELLADVKGRYFELWHAQAQYYER